METASTLTLSLLDIARLTWDRVPKKAENTFADYCKFLYEQKEDVWIITSGSECLGMLTAKLISQGTLYVTMLVTLRNDGFKEFVRQVEGRFGSLKRLKYLRRGRPVEVDFQTFKEKALKYE